MTPSEATPASAYDADYYERGVQTGKSGYQNFTWLPELTIKMAHHLILTLPINRGEKVLDFGCAKGFLVKALRLLDIDAYGVDISAYAIDQVDPMVRGLCALIKDAADPVCFNREYDWLVSKDVFEHLNEAQLRQLLTCAKPKVKRMFAAVPLGKDDGSGYIVPSYDNDVTHIIVKPLRWWMDLFLECGWNVDSATHSFRGVKDNWTASWPRGNAFFVISRPPA
ncbi:MAG: class I SAM-dependent methyltransferase [Rhodospirillaceae bacterium]|nr:class I SAM-dependent methyltransferase [Rhodospirillaceae bacterium]